VELRHEKVVDTQFYVYNILPVAFLTCLALGYALLAELACLLLMGGLLVALAM
jgi:hypothetical protein